MISRRASANNIGETRERRVSKANVSPTKQFDDPALEIEFLRLQNEELVNALRVERSDNEELRSRLKKAEAENNDLREYMNDRLV